MTTRLITVALIFVLAMPTRAQLLSRLDGVGTTPLEGIYQVRVPTAFAAANENIRMTLIEDSDGNIFSSVFNETRGVLFAYFVNVTDRDGTWYAETVGVTQMFEMAFRYDSETKKIRGVVPHLISGLVNIPFTATPIHNIESILHDIGAENNFDSKNAPPIPGTFLMEWSGMNKPARLKINDSVVRAGKHFGGIDSDSVKMVFAQSQFDTLNGVLKMTSKRPVEPRYFSRKLSIYINLNPRSKGYMTGALVVASNASLQLVKFSREKEQTKSKKPAVTEPILPEIVVKE